MRLGSNRVLVSLAAVGVLAITFFTLSRAIGFRGDDPVFVTPRESVTWTMAQSWADTGRPTVVEPAIEDLPGGIGIALTPRDGAAAGNELLPKEFPLTVAMYAAALKIHPALAYALNPLQGVLLLVAVAVLGRQLGGTWRAGLFAGALLLTTLSFWSSSATPVAADTIGAAALVATASVLLQQSRGSDASTGIVGGLLVAVATAGRYTLIGPGVVLVFCLWAFGPMRFRRGCAAAVGLAIGLLPVLAYHDWVYGGPFTTGYAIGDSVFQREIGLQSGSLLSFDSGNLQNHLWFYIATPSTIALAGLAFLGVRGRREQRDIRGLAVAFGVTLVSLFAFHGGQGTWGAQAFVVNASLLRYLLIIFVLLSLFGGLALDRLKSERLMVAVPLVLLAISWAISSANSGAAGFLANARQIDNQALVRENVLGIVPTDAIIVSRLGSKTFFPQRRVMSASLMRGGQIADLKAGQSVWELVPAPAQLAAAFASIHDADYQLFLHNDGEWLDEGQLDLIENELRGFGLTMADRSTLSDPLFEVVAAEE